jgi:hypothetical protein
VGETGAGKPAGSEMKVLICVPCSEFVKSKWWAWLENWRDTTEHRVRILPETTPNRMDWSVSAMIGVAKKERPAWLIRLDSDVRPQIPLDACISIAEENFAKYRCVSGSPTIRESGDKAVIQALPVSGVLSSFVPFEVTWMGGGLNLIPNDVYDAFQPLGEFTGQDGVSKMKLYIPSQKGSETEDVSFCGMVRKYGFTVYADPRLLTDQRKGDTYMPSFRAGMTEGAKMEVTLTA